jgi:hypothetical protein
VARQRLDGRVIKNEDDDGWAVEMLKDGEREPAWSARGRWGRDKMNPKPSTSRRSTRSSRPPPKCSGAHEQQLHAALHKQFRPWPPTPARLSRHPRHRARRIRSARAARGMQTKPDEPGRPGARAARLPSHLASKRRDWVEGGFASRPEVAAAPTGPSGAAVHPARVAAAAARCAGAGRPPADRQHALDHGGSASPSQTSASTIMCAAS